MNNYAYIGFLSTDNYLNGILILNENLKQLKSKYPFIVLCNKNLSLKTYNILAEKNIEYKIIENEIQHLDKYLNKQQPRWIYTLNKIEIFNLLNYDRCIYLDCDMLILDNLDYLFDLNETFISGSYFSPMTNSPTPQSNILVYSPNFNIFNDIKNILLNNFGEFGDEYYIFNYICNNNFSLKLLPFNYNCTTSFENNSVYLTFKKDNSKIKIIHFVGEEKPWFNENNLKKYILDRGFPEQIAELYYILYKKASKN